MHVRKIVRNDMVCDACRGQVHSLLLSRCQTAFTVPQDDIVSIQLLTKLPGRSQVSTSRGAEFIILMVKKWLDWS